MRFVLAPDSFKESMSAPEAAAAMARGVRTALSDADCDEVPMSDGGEGFAATLAAAMGGVLDPVTVPDALGRDVRAHLGYEPRERVAIVEAAQAVGLARIPPDARDVMAASSEGVGHLIAAALDRGCRRIVVGLGGSATNDGGAGMLQALGVRFLADDGRELDPFPGALQRLASIDDRALDPRLRGVTIEVATDVQNPLLGPDGASATFGPQKGASPAQVVELDAVLARIAAASGSLSDLAHVAGAGAAGGLGFALRAFLGARLVPGIDLVMAATRLPDRISGADYVLTGEGSIDAQTALGKAPAGVARVAAAAGVPTIAFGGRIEAGASALGDFLAIVPIAPGPGDLPTALAAGPANLERATAMVCRLLTRAPTRR